MIGFEAPEKFGGPRAPDAEIGPVIPSIAHALTRLCSMADWPS
ncbi:MAG: hypothetical protein QOI05_3703 [Bradyrhizobium sp.]|jgi:hypothetical protein|nr:hypothetical protein [Bradyrhizobium sp.]